MVETGLCKKLRGLLLATLMIMSMVAGSPISVNVATAGNAAGNTSITVTDLSLHENRGYTHEPLTAEVTINNSQTKSDTKIVRVWYSDGYSWYTGATENVTVAANSSKTVNVSYVIEERPDNGTAIIKVDGLQSAIDIDRTPTSIRSISVGDNNVTSGDSITTEVSVENYESESVERVVTLDWGDASEQSQSTKSVTIPGDSTSVLTFQPTLDIPGYQVLSAGYGHSSPVKVTADDTKVDVSSPNILSEDIYAGERLSANTTVENTGSNFTNYMVTLVASEADDDGKNEYEKRIFGLASGEEKNVTLEKSIYHHGDYNISINAESAGRLQLDRPYNVTDISTKKSTVVAGKSVTIEANVTSRLNSGDQFDLALERLERGHWDYKANEQKFINGGETEKLSFKIAPSDIGSQTYRIENSDRLSLEVASEVNVTNISVSDATPYENAPFFVNASVSNRRSTPVTTNVTLYEDRKDYDRTLIEKEVSLDSSERKRISFQTVLEYDDNKTLRVESSKPFNVSVQDSPIRVSSVTVGDEPIEVGNETTVSVTLQNQGETGADYRTTLEIGEHPYDRTVSKTTHVAGNSVETVSFTPNFTVPGIHLLHAGHTSKRLTVTESNNGINISNASVLTQSIYQDDSARAEVTVANSGSTDSQYALVLTAKDGRTTRYDTTSVSLSAGESRTVELGPRLSNPGNYSISVNSQNIGSTAVERPYTVTNLSVNETSIVRGESLNFTATVKNHLQSEFTTRVDFTIESLPDASHTYSRGKEISLNGSEKKTISFQDSTGSTSELGQNEVTFGDSQPIIIDIISATKTTDIRLPDSVREMSPTSIKATVTNRANSDIDSISLYRTDSSNQWYSFKEYPVHLNASESKNVTIPHTFRNDGNESLRIGSSDVVNITVQESPVRLQGVLVENRTLDAGEEATIRATLRNTGQTAVDYEASLYIDGDNWENEREINKTVTVPAGETEIVTFSPSFSVAGTHELQVGYEDAGLVTVGSQDVSVEFGSVARDTVREGQEIPVSVQLNNTANSSKEFALTVRYSKESSEWTGDSTTVVTTLSPGINNRTVLLRPYSIGNMTVSVNGMVTDSFSVRHGLVVQEREFSHRVVKVNESVWLNETIRNPTSSKQKHSVSVGNQGYPYYLSPGETKEFSREFSFETPGEKRVWIDGSRSAVYVVEETTGNPDLDFKRVYTPNRIVTGTEDGVYAEITNSGDAAALRDIELTVNGTTVDNETILVPAKETRSVYLRHVFSGNGTFNGTVSITNGSDHDFQGSIRSPVIVNGSVNVSYESGSRPVKLPDVDAEYRSGSVYITATQPDSHARELTALGIDKTTELNITFLAADFTPRVVVGNGHDVSVTLENTTQPGLTRVTTQIKPGELDYKFDFAGDRPTSPNEWDANVQNNTADRSWDSTIRFRVGNAQTAVQSANASATAGMTVSTDAQMYSMPRYVPGGNTTAPHLEVSLAAPHTTTSRNINDGYYEAHLPATLLDEWNVTDPTKQLSASFAQQNVSMDVTETADGGAFVDISLHYSSGTLEIRKSDSEPSDDEEQESSSDGNEGDLDSEDSEETSSPTDSDGSGDQGTGEEIKDESGTEDTPTETTTPTETEGPEDSDTPTETEGPEDSDTPTETDQGETMESNETSITETKDITETDSGIDSSTQSPAQTTEKPHENPSTASGPGFGALLVIVTLLFASVYVGRNQGRKDR